MTTFAEFERKLKAVVRRTPPDNVGNWTRYLSGGVPELEEFIEELCHAFLRGDLSHREAVAEFLTADDDVLWFTARFISEQARTVKGVADCGPLLLGLAATAIIGQSSDPRDVTGWIDALYYAARTAGICDREKQFQNVANLVVSQGGYTATRMRAYPALIEAHETQKTMVPKGTDHPQGIRAGDGRRASS